MNTETGYTLDKHVLFIYIANCIYYYNIYIYIYIYLVITIYGMNINIYSAGNM